ncbi:MAG: hypothetical protein HDR90_00735 [Bacteroides sp.]|nr:hypothetical protein [Bacteroides sp.]
MKKLFTLLAAVSASTLMYGQTTVTWALTDADNQLAGISSADNIVVKDVTAGSNLTIGAVKEYTEGKGTLFSPTTDLKENKKPKTDGTNLVNFTFTVPEGYTFTPTNVSFYGAKDGSGNNHQAEIKLNDITLKSDYTFGRGSDASNPGVVTNYTVAGTALEGDVTLEFNLYGKSTSATKGWVLGDVVVTGNLESKGDTRVAAGIEWTKSELSYKVRDNVPALPELANPNNLDVVYKSSNDAVAEINDAGEVVLKNTTPGSAVVTASFEGDDSYKPAAVSLNITVVTNKVEKKVVDETLETLVPELDAIYKADKESYPAGTLYEDENLSIIAHSETINGKVAAEYGGQKFEKSIQVRVKSEPSDLDPYGDEYGDIETEERKTTSLVVKPNVDLTLYVFGRRQTLEDPDLYTEEDDVENNVITCKHVYSMKANDGKSLKFDDTDEPTVIIEKNIYLGKWDGTDYVFGISEVELKAGQEYNMYAVATTYQVNGIGYIVPKDPNEVSYKNHVVALGTIDGKSSTDAAGYVVTRTGSNNIGKGNSTITVGGTDYNSIKVKGIITGNEQIVYTVAAPEGKVVTSATIYAIANSATPSDKLYFSKVANNTYTEETATLIESNDGKNPTAVAIDHIMLNSFDVELHSGLESSDDISMVVEVVTTDALHAPAAPSASVENEDVAEEIELAGSNKTIVITPAEDHHNVYYHFAEAVAASAPAAVVARAEEADAPVAKFTVNGKEFSLVPAEGVVLSKAGTLSYFSHDPIKDIKSEIKTLSVTGDGATTGIENVAVDAAAAEVEYFNLQGIRVVNPENGVFIRRQGNEVKKVVL